MMNTEFIKGWEPDTIREMTKLWTQIFAVAMEQNLPILSTVVYLNDNFENVYEDSETETEVWQKCFNDLGIVYEMKENPKNP